MDLKELRGLYANCRDEALAPIDPRNVDIDGMKDSPRGISWVQRLARPIELASKPVQTFVTGLPGSGKSTELYRLKDRLEWANFLVVRIDAEERLDLTSPIDIPDIFMVLLLETERRVLEAEGRATEEALQEGYFKRLWRWLNETDVELVKAEFKISTVASLITEMKNRPSLRKRVRDTVANHLTTFLSEARDEFVLLEERAKRLKREGLVLIFDSLEKLRGISTNYEDVLLSAERTFGGGAPYLRLPVHAIFTVPAALTTRQNMEVEFMPMVKLHERNGTPSPSGYLAMRELIRRRLPDAALREILGDDCDRRVGRIIERSGGYPREVVKSLQWLLEIQHFPVTDHDLERAEHETRERFRAVVLREDFAWLARVAQEQTLTIENDQHRQTVDRVLMNNVVLRYCNTDIWFGLHPAVSEIAGIKDAIAGLRRPATTPPPRPAGSS